VNYLLVHGAFRGGWAWGDIRRGLAAAGHDALAPSLLGMGELDPDTLGDAAAGSDITLSDWARQLVRLAELEDLRDLVLVGHSQGGLVAREAAHGLGHRLAALAYIDAPIARLGQRGVDLSGAPAPDASDLPPRSTRLAPTPLTSGATMSEEVASRSNVRLGSTPFGPSLDPVSTPEPDVPVHVAFCRHTPAGYPSTVTRAAMDGAGEDYHVFDAGHDVTLTHPREVTGWLLAMAPAPV